MKNLLIVAVMIIIAVTGSFAEEQKFSPEQALILQKAYDEAMTKVIKKKREEAARKTEKAAEENMQALKETQETEAALIKTIKEDNK